MTWWSKLFSLCPEDIFEEKNFFFTKLSNFSVDFRLLGKHFGFLAKIILLGCQNCFQVSRWYFWKSLFLRTNSLNCFSIFGLRAQIFWTFSEIFAIGLWKLHSMCPVEIFDWTVFLQKYMSFLTVFGPWRNYSAILAQKLPKVYKKCNLCVQKTQGELRTFDRFVKTALYLSEWDFWMNIFFMNFLSFVTVSRLLLEHSATLAQKLWKSCQRCILLEQQIFWGKFVFWRKYLLVQIFRVLMKNSANICRKVFCPDWKTAFYTRSRDLLA